MGKRAERERAGRTRKVALGGALAAGVLGLSARPADASWTGVPPETITIPTTGVTTVDLSGGIFQGFASIASDEIDWYTFVAPRSGTHTVWTSTVTNPPDTVLGVYDGGGNRLAYNDDYIPPDRDSQVGVSLTQGVRYWFGITNYTNTGPGNYEYYVRAPK